MFPTDKPDLSTTRATADDDPLSLPNHRTHHIAEDGNIEGIMGKMGITTSIPAPGTFLHSDIFENSEWNPRPWLLNSYALRAKNSGGFIRQLIHADPSDRCVIGDPALDFRMASPWDGWQPGNATWTRTGDYTFTEPGDVTAKYPKGARIRYKQGGAYEYGVVISSAYTTLTTITLATNDDYAMAAGDLTDNYYSYLETPQGFPQWFALVAPTFAQIDDAAGGQPTIAETRLKIDGRTCTIHLKGNGTKAGAAVFFSFADTNLPTPANTSDRTPLGIAYAFDGANDYIGVLLKEAATFYFIFHASIADNATLSKFGCTFSYEI